MRLVIRVASCFFFFIFVKKEIAPIAPHDAALDNVHLTNNNTARAAIANFARTHTHNKLFKEFYFYTYTSRTGSFARRFFYWCTHAFLFVSTHSARLYIQATNCLKLIIIKYYKSGLIWKDARLVNVLWCTCIQSFVRGLYDDIRSFNFSICEFN